MLSSIRHLIAVVLLVLLPLQAIAAGYAAGAAPLTAGPDAMMAFDGIEYDIDASVACHGRSCLAAVAVAPPVFRTVRTGSRPRCAHVCAVSRIYASYIADGPQRPPRTQS
jgi:hypothetical protein